MKILLMSNSVKFVVFSFVFAICAVLIIKLIAFLHGRIKVYAKLKKLCRSRGGKIKKQRPLFSSVFKCREGCDLTVDAGGKVFKLKFFPGYRRNKNVRIENEKTASIIKPVGSVVWKRSHGGYPYHLAGKLPVIMDDVNVGTIKTSLSAEPGCVNILYFQPRCQSVSYTKNSEAVELYNGDDCFGYTVFYDVEKLTDFIENELDKN